MKSSGCLLAALFVWSVAASAQNFNFELSGGYSYISGDQGQNGYTVGTAVRSKKVALAFDFDRAWGTDQLGNFVLTPTGLIVTKSRIQDFMGGPRFFFPGLIKSQKYHVPLITFFAETEFGASYLRQDLSIPAQNVVRGASDNNFAWLLGGGGDYRVSPHFLARVKADLFRTHFASDGQSRFRLSLQVVYTLKASQPD
jgi:hypothetical protein